MKGGFDAIRRYYGVSAKRGGRVRCVERGGERLATILSCDGQYLWVRFDGEKRRRGPFHPHWLSYLRDDEVSA